MNPRAPHTKYGERRARIQSPEGWHRIGDHDVHQDATCKLCLQQSRSDPHPYR